MYVKGDRSIFPHVFCLMLIEVVNKKVLYYQIIVENSVKQN